MFKTKYEAIAQMNKVANLAMKLNVDFRCSPNGISIIGSETKCFELTEEQLLQAREFVLKQADPSLQTVLKPFYG